MSGAGVGAGPGASCSEMVLPLAMGKPPADSTPLALVLVTLQELYEDLHQFTRLNRVLGEQRDMRQCHREEAREDALLRA